VAVDQAAWSGRIFRHVREQVLVWVLFIFRLQDLEFRLASLPASVGNPPVRAELVSCGNTDASNVAFVDDELNGEFRRVVPAVLNCRDVARFEVFVFVSCTFFSFFSTGSSFSVAAGADCPSMGASSIATAAEADSAEPPAELDCGAAGGASGDSSAAAAAPAEAAAFCRFSSSRVKSIVTRAICEQIF
jgi:hypothetical protein